MIEKAGAAVFPVFTESPTWVDLAAMLSTLAELEVNSLMVEGGARIITSFLMGRLVDYLVMTVAPVLVGGLHAVSDLGEKNVEQMVRLRNSGHHRLGEDLIIWGDLS